MMRDRISALSDDLLLVILKKLPRQDVLKTAVLSRRWEGLWREEIRNSNNLELVCGSETDVADFPAMVQRMLNLINPLQVQIFRFEIFGGIVINNQDGIISLGGRAVEMEINVSTLLSQFPQVVEIKVASYKLTNWPLNCNLLVRLNLTNCSLNDDVFKYILSRTPALEELELTRGRGLRQIIIECPTLRILCLGSPDIFGMIRVTCPLLQEMEINGLADFTSILLNVPPIVTARFDFELKHPYHRAPVQFARRVVHHGRDRIQNPMFSHWLLTAAAPSSSSSSSSPSSSSSSSSSEGEE